MNKLTKDQVTKFLAFMIWNHADIISINYLNEIELSDKKSKNIDYYTSEILSLLEKEILSYEIRNGDKIGLLLSGWLDSTILLCLLKKEFPDSEIFTYTLGYSKDDIHLSKARNIAENYKTTHKEVIHDLNSTLFETFDDIYQSWYYLEGEDSLIMNHILAKEVQKDCKVVFSWFWLDYVFAWMDLFRNSYIEKIFRKWLVDETYLYDILWWNKYYLKYVLDKISLLDEDFFVKYWEYYGYTLKEWLEKDSIDYFYGNLWTIRWDISELKKQIYFIISTSLSNRFNPYNEPYRKLWVKHCNPFWSKNIISKIIALNIPDEFLYNPYTKEKKFIIRKIAKSLITKDVLTNLHTGTVLTYEKAFKENKEFLSEFYSEKFLSNIENTIDDSTWYERSKQIIILLQFLFYHKNNS